MKIPRLIGDKMHVDLREGNRDVVFSKLLKDDLSDVRFHTLNSENIVAEEQQIKIEGRAAKIDKTCDNGGFVGYILMLQCALLQYFYHQIDVTSIRDAYSDLKPCSLLLMTPVDHLVGGDQLVGDDDDDLVSVDRF